MSKLALMEVPASSSFYETLETEMRGHVQGWLQDLLEEERDLFLERLRYARRTEGQDGSRSGYGKPGHLATTMGTLTVRRPRVRGLNERFESAILPLFKRRTAEVGKLLPQLYLHGLAEGDFDKALRGLLGEGAPAPSPA